MSKIRYINFLLLLLFVAFGISSCKTSKQIANAPVKEKVLNQLFDSLKANELKYEWIRAKFDASVSINKKKNSFSGSMRIRRDSTIWISISPALGIEMFRLLLTPDSIQMINRIESTCYLGNFGYIAKLINADVDFEMLLAFLTGNDFAYYENDKFKSSVDKNQYHLSTVGRRKLKKASVITNSEPLTEDIWLNPSDFKIVKHRINEFKENRKFEANYLAFDDINGQKYAKTFEFEVSAKDKIVITIDFTRFEIDTPQEFPFTVPEQYKQAN